MCPCVHGLCPLGSGTTWSLTSYSLGPDLAPWLDGAAEQSLSVYVAFPRYPCSLGGDPLGRNTGTRKLEMLLDASQVPPRKCAGGGGGENTCPQ